MLLVAKDIGKKLTCMTRNKFGIFLKWIKHKLPQQYL